MSAVAQESIPANRPANRSEKRLGAEILTEFAFRQAKFKAEQLAPRPEFADCDPEDVEQELLMYLIQKADAYDPSRSKLNTFIDCVLTSGVRELLRSKKRHKRHPIDEDIQVQSFEQTVDTVDETFANLGDEISTEDLGRRTSGCYVDPFEEVEEREAIEVAVSHLSPQLQDIVRVMGNQSHNETMRQFELSRRQFDKARAEIRETFERFDATFFWE